MKTTKTPEECTLSELENFITAHNLSLPSNSNRVLYRQLLLRLSTGILDSLHRDRITVEDNSFSGKLKKQWGKIFKRGQHSVHSEPVAVGQGQSNRQTFFMPYESQYEENIAQDISAKLDDLDIENDSFDQSEIVYANVHRPPAIPTRDISYAPPRDISYAPPLPPKSYRLKPENSRYSDQSSPELGRPSFHQNVNPPIMEMTFEPNRKKRKLEFEKPIPFQSTPGQNRHGNFGKAYKPENIFGTKGNQMLKNNFFPTEIPNLNQSVLPFKQNIAKPEQLTVAQPVVPSYKTKFTTIYKEKDCDIEQYITALQRWKRLNAIPDSIAISAGLQNFASCELANYTESGLSPEAFENFETFSTELRKLLGRTSEQWLDFFDSCRRKPTESTFTFFARLQSILKSALKITEFSDEHKRLIRRKFLKSVHPTLRGHLELREIEPTFEELPFLANKIELSLDLPKGSTVEIHNLTEPPKAKTSNTPKNGRSVSFQKKDPCQICKKISHTTDFCFGNPMSKSYDLERFHAIHNTKN